jgi:predicted Zn-dependent peptidase
MTSLGSHLLAAREKKVAYSQKGWRNDIYMFEDLYADFQIEVLDNGLSIYLREWPAPWVYVGILVHAGGREDLPGREGLAHLVEHAVTENVAGLTFSQLKKRFEAMGGYGWFGTTSYLASKYAFQVPGIQKSVHEALSLFGRMLLQGKLVRHIEEEKLIIQSEYNRKYGHQEARKWSLQGRPFLFEHHPRLHSFASAIGIPDEFICSTPQEIQQFYDAYYTPQNMSLVCIGSITMPTLLSLLQDTPFALHNPGERTSIPMAFFPEPPKKQQHIIRLSEYSQLAPSKATCTFEWVLPCVSRKHACTFCAIC